LFVSELCKLRSLKYVVNLRSYTLTTFVCGIEILG
jgi:hypothetical protein